jgi:hypothetical protein
MAPFMSDPRCHTADGPSQYRPSPSLGHRHTTDVADGQKWAMLVDTSKHHVTLNITYRLFIQRVLWWDKAVYCACVCLSR